MFQREFRANIFDMNTSEIIPKAETKSFIIEAQFFLSFFPELDRSTAPAWNSIWFIVFLNR